MIWRSLLLSPLLFGAGSVQAFCDWEKGSPAILSVPDQVITIAADAPADSSTPIAAFETPRLGHDIFYTYCLVGTEVGRRVIGLESYSARDKTFKTNIPGIVIKPLWTNGLPGWGGFPTTVYMPPMDDSGYVYFRFPDVSGYRVEFYKVADSLQLKNPAGDLVLPPGPIGYFYLIVSDDPNNYLSKLSLNEIKVISTPVCTPDSAKTVDFGKVTAKMLENGVSEKLDFAINCKSDYGSYSATAYITTDTPSYDAANIMVKDAGGNSGRLRITIKDSQNRPLRVNGKEGEQITSTPSQNNAEFHWTAELSAAGWFQPSAGTFSAKAEIIFDIT